MVSTRPNVDVLSKYREERKHFLSYLTYFSNKINQDHQRGKSAEYFKAQSYFKALALFDAVLNKLDRREEFDFRKCMVIAQTCLYMASKIHDIYSVSFVKIEEDSANRQ